VARRPSPIRTKAPAARSVAFSPFFWAALLTAAPAFATETRPVPEPPAAQAAPPRVRVALSKKAAERLFELRMRRLLQIELDDAARVEPELAGPLGGELILVWIDLPEPRRAMIEVRRIHGALARRSIAVGGFPDDVAAEAVALAAAEMVRVQAHIPPVKPPSDTPPVATRPADVPSFGIEGASDALLLPASEPVAFAGPRLSLALEKGIFNQTLHGRWLFGDGERLARWFEVGGGLGLRFPFGEDGGWRIGVGLQAGFAAVRLPGATTVDGEASEDAWTVHGAAALALQARVTRDTWLSLAVEPGAALRTLTVADGAGERDLGGFALGIHLGILALGRDDVVTAPAPPAQSK
jgi:hypothetical protein